MLGKYPSTLRTVSVSLSVSLLAATLLAACASAHRNPDIQLIRAAEKGQTREMLRLIKSGADVNAMDMEGWTPYLAASTMGQLDAMHMLKSLGARTEAPEMELVNAARKFIAH